MCHTQMADGQGIMAECDTKKVICKLLCLQMTFVAGGGPEPSTSGL